MIDVGDDGEVADVGEVGHRGAISFQLSAISAAGT
jgi:hypothetical protein